MDAYHVGMRNYVIMCLRICGLAASSAQAGFFGAGGAITDGPDGVTTFELNIPGSGPALPRVLLSLDTFHTWVGDLTITLEHDGTTVTVLDRLGVPETPFGNSGNFDGVYEFDSQPAMSWAAFDNSGGSTDDVIPEGLYSVNNTDGTSLQDFVGLDIHGLWTLTISDAVASDTGGLRSWRLQFLPGPGSASLFGMGAFTALRRRRGK